ncbi:hypothetical protein EYF80_026872 [Liparis tanakae]|uniref:Uncharacterized protein n=1 Tax=Liparis tanakae TaxID=230148 RepID=A0A4Z2HBL7_9TELE|nr:hypothetical protein EYF80_026872 [Liparis tanakae]
MSTSPSGEGGAEKVSTQASGTEFLMSYRKRNMKATFARAIPSLDIIDPARPWRLSEYGNEAFHLFPDARRESLSYLSQSSAGFRWDCRPCKTSRARHTSMSDPKQC